MQSFPNVDLEDFYSSRPERKMGRTTCLPNNSFMIHCFLLTSKICCRGKKTRRVTPRLSATSNSRRGLIVQAPVVTHPKRRRAILSPIALKSEPCSAGGVYHRIERICVPRIGRTSGHKQRRNDDSAASVIQGHSRHAELPGKSGSHHASRNR